MSVLNATEYRLFIEPDFETLTYNAHCEIEVEFLEEVQDFEVKISKNLTFDTASFFYANFIFRGNPNFTGAPVEITYNEETQILSGKMPHPVNKELTTEGAYICISYEGTIGEKGSDAALITEGKGAINTNLENGAYNLFPVLDDNDAKFDLRVTTNAQSTIESSLVSAGSYKHFNEEKYTVRVNSNGENVKLNDIAFTILLQ